MSIHYSIYTCFLIGLLTLQACSDNKQATSGDDATLQTGKKEMADKVRTEFLHAWNTYKKYAWEHDALKPLSKTYRDWYAHSLLMTPVDAYDTMILMGLTDEANECKELIINKLSFDHDMSVQVFEVTIRLLGSLVTAYQMDGDPAFLALAKDLGNRLLPAFDSPTGMPYRMVNLKTGETGDAMSNPAEIGTLLIEFGTLSKLTGDPVYYDKARKAITELYNRRSDIGLVGTVIDVNTGEWQQTESHISGMIDSYYEYLLKGAILFDDPALREMYDNSMVAVNRYCLDTVPSGIWYGHVDMTGNRISRQFGALDAFMPGMLALGGEVELAQKVQESCFKMWKDFGIEPEQMDYDSMKILVPSYVLRPENIESAAYLYHYTGDEKYLVMGTFMVNSLITHCRLDEGYAAIRDVTTMEKMDDMESFFFAETLKYAYLLFADNTGLDFKNTIFNTEAHPVKKTW